MELRMNPRLAFSLLAILLFGIPAQAQDPAKQIEVARVDIRPRGAKVGEEITVTATLRNLTTRLLLVNTRVVVPEQLAVLVPEVEQIVFLEGGGSRGVSWRAKVVKEGTWTVRAGAEVVSEGRPVAGPAPEVVAPVKEALARAWTGTWQSPSGFVYDAELRLQLNPNGSVEGRLNWLLQKAPAERTDYAGKTGARGTEFIWGTFDPQTRSLDMAGYRRDDPQVILGLDKYRLTLSEKGDEIKGATWNHGTWAAAFTLTPVVPPTAENRKLGGYPEGVNGMIVGSLVLSPGRKAVAYSSRSDGTHIIEGDKIVASAPNDQGIHLEKYTPDDRLIYSIRSKGGAHIVVGSEQGPSYDQIHSVATASNGRIVYRAEKAGKQLLVEGSKEEEIEGLESVSLSSDGAHLAYVVRIGGRATVVTDGKKGAEFDDVQTPSFDPGSAVPTYAATRGNRKVAIVGDREAGEFENITAVDVSPDGRTVAVLAAEGGRLEPWFGIKVYKGGRHFVLINGLKGPEFDEITYPRMSRTGRVAYAARKGTAWSLVVDGIKGPDFDGVNGYHIAFSPDSSHVAYAANIGGTYDTQLRFQKGGVEWLVIDHEKVTSDITSLELRFAPDGKTVAYQQRVERARQLVVGTKKGPVVDEIFGDTVEFSPDGKSVSYVVRIGRELFLQTVTLDATAAAKDPAKESAVRSTLAALRNALALYKLDTNVFPTTEQGLQALIAAPAGAANWKGPYVEGKIPSDPWGSPYVYRSPGTRNPSDYDLFSSGPDGKPGTQDDVTR
jgi:type II secretion system protein G